MRRIIVAYTVNRLGTWFGLVALMLAVYDHTHSALAVAALLFAGQALPAFLVPVVVARVEASRRRSELSALYIFEAVVTTGLALLLWNFSLPAVLVLVALDGTAALAANALLRSELARAARSEVEAEDVRADVARDHDASTPDREAAAHEAEREANGALNVAFSATFVLGPVLGGVVVALAGAPAALLIDVATFVICGCLLLDLHPYVDEAAGDSVGARLNAARRYIQQAPRLRALLLVDAFAMIFFEAGGPIEVTFAKSTLHAGDRGFGLLLTTWGAGTVIGSVFFARSNRLSLPAMLSAGAFGIGGAYLGFALAPSLAVACVAALAGGIGNGVELPSLVTLVQRLTPPRLHGRLMGAVESLDSLCLAIGLPLGGLLVAASSPRGAFFVVGCGTVAASAGLLAISRGGDDPASESQLRAAGHDGASGEALEPGASGTTADREISPLDRPAGIDPV